jgi:hypothetical protein
MLDPILSEEVDSDSRKIRDVSAFLVRMPRHQEIQLAPSIVGQIAEVQDGARPSIVVCHNVVSANRI